MNEFLFLPLAFFIIALIYSSVGFGGGSSYIAVMSLMSVSPFILPKISLLLNIIVVTNGTYIYCKSNHLDIKKTLPFIIGSIPFAIIGATLKISATNFKALMALTLIAASFNLIFIDSSLRKKLKDNYLNNHSNNSGIVNKSKPVLTLIEFGIGAGIGLLSGLLGIGGGIFLAPILYILKWGYAKQISATSSFFILLNSIAGIAGHFSLNTLHINLSLFVPLAISVFIGSQIGSRFGAFKLRESLVKLITAIILDIASIKLIYQVYF